MKKPVSTKGLHKETFKEVDYYLKPQSVEIRAMIEDASTEYIYDKSRPNENMKQRVNTGTRKIDNVKYSLKKISNLGGKELIILDDDIVSSEVLNRLGMTVINHLSFVIDDINELTYEEKQNLGQ